MTRPRVIGDWSDAIARIIVCSLFFGLASRFLNDFRATGRITDLLLVIGEVLVVVLTCLRRPATVVDRRPIVRFVTTVSMLAPLMLRPATSDAAILPEVYAAIFVGLGLITVVAGKISLGFSFGLLPANRGVMERGLYRFVRHPIYLGYLLTHIPFLAAHPSTWNLVLLLVGDSTLIVRALYEEQTLVRDPRYVRYCKTVKWRLVPGLC